MAGLCCCVSVAKHSQEKGEGGRLQFRPGAERPREKAAGPGGAAGAEGQVGPSPGGWGGGGGDKLNLTFLVLCPIQLPVPYMKQIILYQIYSFFFLYIL